MAGELNGTGVYLLMFVGGTPVLIGGQLSHNQALSAKSINVTNKAAGEGERVLNQDGALSESISMELLFSSDATFLLLRDAVGAATIQTFIISKPGWDDETIVGIPNTYNESSDLSGKLIASVSIQVGDDSADAPRLTEKIFGVES